MGFLWAPGAVCLVRERSCMNGDKVFTDTNIVVYAYDSAAGRKHQIAATAMKDLWHSGLGLLSNQVLQQFFVTVTKKIASPLETGLAKRIIKNLSKWDVVINDVDIILEAIDLQERYKFGSFAKKLKVEIGYPVQGVKKHTSDLSQLW